MQTRMRSPAAHGPEMARACICASNCSSTRSAVRRSARLAQRRQVGGCEEMRERALGLLGNVDLAFLETLDQVVRRHVDEFDRVGTIEGRVGHRFVDPDAGDLGDDVVEALDVLDIDGGIDVDVLA